MFFLESLSLKNLSFLYFVHTVQPPAVRASDSRLVPFVPPVWGELPPRSAQRVFGSRARPAALDARAARQMCRLEGRRLFRACALQASKWPAPPAASSDAYGAALTAPTERRCRRLWRLAFRCRGPSGTASASSGRASPRRVALSAGAGVRRDARRPEGLCERHSSGTGERYRGERSSLSQACSCFYCGRGHCWS